VIVAARADRKFEFKKAATKKLTDEAQDGEKNR